MDEGNLEPEEAAPRALIDQLDPLGGESFELAADIVDLEGDVVHARAALRQKLTDRRVGTERGEQLNPARADAERSRLDALFTQHLAVLELGVEEPPVCVDRGIEANHRNADVMDAGHRSIVPADLRDTIVAMKRCGGSLLIATTGSADPIQLTAGSGNTGSLTFSDWNDAVTLAAPKNPIDYGKLISSS